MPRKVLLFAGLIAMLVFSLLSPQPAAAQGQGLQYQVQEGDTLDSIAQAFHTTANRIRIYNYFSDADYIYPGQKIYIPGFLDVQGEAMKVKMPFGQSLAAYFGSLQQPLDFLQRLNFIINMDQVYAGQPLYIMYTEQPAVKEVQVGSSMTGLELAVKQGVNEWTPLIQNQLRDTLMLIPNTSLWLPDAEAVAGVSLPPAADMKITPYPLFQGKTAELTISAPADGTSLSGSLILSVNDSLGLSPNYTSTTYPLSFFQNDNGELVALQGVHRFARPGMAAMVLTKTTPDGSTFSIQQNLLVKTWEYGTDTPIIVDASFIDPAITVPEYEMMMELVKDAPPEKMWTFGFESPVPEAPDWISRYGLLRSYNDSDLIYFHSGIDYPGGTSTAVHAVADGVVVFAGLLDVRGNATILSHGRGVYSGYWHQSRIDVKVGDLVSAGQIIGMVGNTGRVTGAHLHLEVLVGGVQVDPSEWLQGLY